MIAWLLAIWLREYLWQIVFTVVLGLVCLAMTFLWAISIIYNPNGGGVYWLAAQSQPGQQLPLSIPIPSIGGFVPGPLTLPPITSPGGFFTDAQRFQLALSVGFSATEAVTATAISIAEDGSGNPAAISPPNNDAAHSVDIGLWQINSGHAPEFGGIQALLDPVTNARAARTLYLRGGWNQWCTYPGGCGGGPGARGWFQDLARAQAVSH